MDFDWDDDKAATNLRKHAIDFPTAARVFLDPYVIEYDDDEPSEVRHNAIGMVDGRPLHVTSTVRGAACWIISARGARPREKKRHHEIQA
jgi:uncharacterized protein